MRPSLVFLWLLALSPLGRPAFAQDEPAGAELYARYCASCHGAGLDGGNGSSLIDGEWAFGDTHDEILKSIKVGLVDRGMPAFGEVLSDAQIGHVIAYIRSVEDDASAALRLATDSLETLDYAIEAGVFAEGLDIPWAIDFIDGRTALVTERPGRLRVVEDGRLRAEPVAGTPEVLHEGQGGLLDVAVDPDYAENGWIYLSYSHVLPLEEDTTAATDTTASEDDEEEKPPAMTRIVRGRLDGNTWTDQEVVFEAPHDTYRTTRHHYGSRIVFDPEGYLYFSIGDRGGRDHAQDLSRPNGKVHRVHPDGSVPEDNPFVAREGALPSIFTYGHRNPQGLAVHPATGEVWDAEHGPRGGDELNRLVAGRNYGWPEITYGINYDGTTITTDRRRLGMEQPTLYWRPSIAVSSIAFYEGDRFPYWKGHLLVGALSFEEVRLLNIEGDRVMHEEVILKGAGRVRDAVSGPDGALYVVLNDPGVVLRLTPREAAAGGAATSSEQSE